MERSATTRLPMHPPGPDTEWEPRAFIETLDLSFRAQELGFATLQIADNVDLAAAAQRRSWRDRLLGREPGALTRPLASARERAAAHLRPNSVWLHNSLRGAVGLGIAVALADLTSVQHSFWVLLGTLSVLRSNALNTGQNAVRALGGTIAGSLIGAGLLHLIGRHGTLLWFLLPLAVLIAGIAPSAISFAAGQAAFTITLVIMFNIDQNPDWHIALLRIQDIGIGCAVSVLVGLFFWPRGAAAAVNQALAEAYTDSARYLAGAVDYAVSRCSAGPAPADAPLQERRQAAAAARRLDDAFRSYLAERGPKRAAGGHDRPGHRRRRTASRRRRRARTMATRQRTAHRSGPGRSPPRTTGRRRSSVQLVPRPGEQPRPAHLAPGSAATQSCRRGSPGRLPPPRPA